MPPRRDEREVGCRHVTDQRQNRTRVDLGLRRGDTHGGRRACDDAQCHRRRVRSIALGCRDAHTVLRAGDEEARGHDDAASGRGRDHGRVGDVANKAVEVHGISDEVDAGAAIAADAAPHKRPRLVAVVLIGRAARVELHGRVRPDSRLLSSCQHRSHGARRDMHRDGGRVREVAVAVRHGRHTHLVLRANGERASWHDEAVRVLARRDGRNGCVGRRDGVQRPAECKLGVGGVGCAVVVVVVRTGGGLHVNTVARSSLRTHRQSGSRLERQRL
mmetsp:Transcript_16164/g.56433  ORF Transcript_16164/g.56433 Transcript_16164/m.56433 type:complete len:274 (+) Transcript_16164:207-1028(+)